MREIEELSPAAITDESPWLALNNAHAEELSYLTPLRLRKLIGEAFMAVKVGIGDALLIAFDQDADYDSENFLWFKRRLSSFVYVDRVVVDPATRGQGLARQLYRELFVRAAAAGHTRIVCEVNSNPPNPGSDKFHLSLGFAEVGTASISNGTKQVRYYSRPLSAREGPRLDASP
jgi:uncharacterized protein